MSIRARQVLLLVLGAIFAAQTWMVYTDPAGTRTRLSGLAVEGQALWRASNCQSCHQLYGFGGFLGPDLTNAVGTLSPERLEAILTEGAGQMPAFRFGPSARRALRAFLAEIDASGVSQPSLGEAVPPLELLRRLTAGIDPITPELARGRELVLDQNCIGCHLPNEESTHRSTDLTRISESVAHEAVLTILSEGIQGTAMPRLALSAEDGAAVYALLAWLEEHGAEIRGRFERAATSGELELSRVPWFEFR